MSGGENKGRALFDIKPVDEAGSVDVEKISAIKQTVDLAVFRPKKKIAKKEPATTAKQEAGSMNQGKRFTDIPETSKQVLPPVIGLPSQQSIKEEFDDLMNHNLDLGIELAKIGSQEIHNIEAKPRYRIVKSYVSSKDPHLALISEIHHSATTIARAEYTDPDIVVEPTLAAVSLALSPAVETDVRDFYTPSEVQLVAHKPHPNPPKFSGGKLRLGIGGLRRVKKLFYSRFVIGAIIVLILLGLVVRYGFHLKNQVLNQSSEAVTHLEIAQNDLQALDFKTASQDFFSAYSSFTQAGDSLNVFGAGITDIISTLPGGNTLKSAKNLLQMGQLLSAAGTSMTTALNAVSRTGAFALSALHAQAWQAGDPTSAGWRTDVPIGSIVSALKKALVASQQYVTQASTLLADIDTSIIPADKQASFEDFKSKFPELMVGVNMSADYAKFFENLITTKSYQRYLVMFQNGSELRPTGGFPGTYGTISFKDGKLDMIFVDDVYNLDGQLKEHIIPPLQLQHITPSWGMRDANWYVDFPTSARNIEAFYKKESGQDINGVIIINPEMIAKVLAIVGPIEMSQYNLTLTADNVLTTLQAQVEYGTNRAQPKQIIKDFAPLFLVKIYSTGSDKWLSIFNTLVLSINQHDMLMNFKNLSLQSFVTDKGFAGQVHQGNSDYLMATITNVKGSKTDAVTDTSLAVDTKFENADAIHTVTITRQHNGGGAKYGFYNKQNPAYVRVLVPDGTELVSVVGNDIPNFKPLINYAKDKSFVRDDGLVNFESSGTVDNASGVTTYKESGKTEFGFWLITDPGATKTVTLQYRVPKVLTDQPLSKTSASQGKTYQLYIQKQPALKIKNFSFSMQKSDNLTPEASAPLLTLNGSTYSYSGSLDNDLTVTVNFK